MTDMPLPKTSDPATAALAVIGVATLTQLAEYTEKELAALHGVGPKALRIWKETMAEHGLSFRKAVVD